MANKQQLQTNNTKYASLIETLRGKAVSGGTEDLDSELTTQESLIAELGSILDSKASGSSGVGSIETCNVYLIMGTATEGRFVAYTTLDASGNMTPTILYNCGSAATPLVCVCNTPLILYRNDQAGTWLSLTTQLLELYSNPSQGIYVFNGGTQANAEYWIRFEYDGS